MNTAPTHDTMVAAFMASDPTYDGVFFTAVKTTGIFCRPGCPARKPLPQNVAFYPTVREAMFAGYVRASGARRSTRRVSRPTGSRA